MSYSFRFYNNTSNGAVVEKNLVSLGLAIDTDYIHMEYASPNYNIVLDIPPQAVNDYERVNYMTIAHGGKLYYFFINSKTFNHGKLYLVCEKDLVSTYWLNYRGKELTIATTEEPLNPYLKDNYILSTEREIAYVESKVQPFSTKNLSAQSFLLELAGGV